MLPVMVEAVLVLGTLAATPRKLVVGLMMTDLCHLRIGCLKYYLS